MRLPRIAAALPLLLAACAGNTAPDGPAPLLAGNNSSVMQQAFRTAQDPAEMDTLWSEAFGRQGTPPPKPAVDFARQRVLAVFMGNQSHGGYGIRLAAVREGADDVEVDVLFTAPGPDCRTTQVLTQPYAVFALPAGMKPLRYVVERQVNNC